MRSAIGQQLTLAVVDPQPRVGQRPELRDQGLGGEFLAIVPPEKTVKAPPSGAELSPRSPSTTAVGAGGLTHNRPSVNFGRPLMLPIVRTPFAISTLRCGIVFVSHTGEIRPSSNRPGLACVSRADRRGLGSISRLTKRHSARALFPRHRLASPTTDER